MAECVFDARVGIDCGRCRDGGSADFVLLFQALVDLLDTLGLTFRYGNGLKPRIDFVLTLFLRLGDSLGLCFGQALQFGFSLSLGLATSLFGLPSGFSLTLLLR
ncbi:hypothetical protein F3G89_12230 [Pseudomonas aeruginosa]|nr:hypothetical protein HV91_31665 [Pseudomonas aeruginosa]KAA5630105.1 hypothetical protein F3G89_12230 [Pseudomonas aeruginosa]KSK89216.1 hypothetical protein APA31_26745 [Pseudomonas aeruginosa]MCO1667744.1 hypothetical protein [Pseudomonas aeruginosa]MCO1723370.1 hypothetical protein [Pseudomonas aeruginosa]